MEVILCILDQQKSCIRQWIIEDRLNQFHLFRLLWHLVSFTEKSVPEMYSILISKKKYQAALDFADSHGLDKDKVLKSQWLNSSHGVNEIKNFLSNIKDKDFVLSECVDRIGVTEDAVKALLDYGLRITDHHKFSIVDDDNSSKVWNGRLARLQILQFRDRLETYLGINMGRQVTDVYFVKIIIFFFMLLLNLSFFLYVFLFLSFIKIEISLRR